MFYKLRDWIDINNIDWKYLSFNPNAIQLLKDNINKIDWNYLSLNPNGIELLKKHENLPEDYRMEHDVLLDDLQLKKIRVLRMKYSAEKIQNKKINLSRKDINDMVGDRDQDEEAETPASTAKSTKAPENKVEDVASAFNDLFNS